MSVFGTSQSLRFPVAALALCLAAAIGCCVPGLRGQEPGANGAGVRPAVSSDHASARAARLTFVAGAVQVQRSDNTAEDNAVLNMPLNEGTRLVTGDYGQAEIELEDGSVARLTPRSSLSLDTLALDASGGARTRLTLLRGLAYFELRKASGYAYQVDAGGTSFSPIENATVRVTLEDAPASIAVFVGSVHVERSDGFSTEVHTGESLSADAQDQRRYFLSSGVTEESWDQWNQSRDQSANDDADRRTAARDNYASGQGYGWSDLDANGSWYNLPGNGPVWQPNVADQSFDPYGYGNWVWSNAGYVWASGYSWGWTPFRCGQWGFYQSFGWGWTPGLGCNQWGYGGLGYLSPGYGVGFGGGGYGGGGYGSGFVALGPVPTRYKPVRIPIAGPGKVHPILTVHGPDGARPPVLHGGPVKIAGTTLLPLKPVVGSGGHSQTFTAQSFNRDAPIDARTHQPVLGTIPGTVFANNPTAYGGRPTPGAYPITNGGSNPRTSYAGSSRPANSRSTPSRSDTGPAAGLPPGRPASPQVPSTATVPPRPVSPPIAAPVRSSPPPPPMAAPVRSSPPPSAPAPVHSAPPPSYAPAPSRSEAAPAPRGK